MTTPLTRPGESAATVTARALVEGLIDAGVRHVVLCPGSRSAPLAYAVHAAAAVGAMRLHVRIDERSAAFTALGIGRVTGVPAVVVTTSGTAVANLLPAVLEAYHARVPLVVLTADRPARLRGTWANQTSELQAGLLGAAVRRAVDVEASTQPGPWHDVAAVSVAAALGDVGGVGPGAVHLNVGFDDPLVPADPQWVPVGRTDRVVSESGAGPTAGTELALGPATVVVAGDGAGPGARDLAEAAGWPLLAEPTSGARGGPCLVPAYRLLLDGALAGAVERVVVYGRPTLSRPVTRLLAREDVELVVVAPAGVPAGDPGREARHVSGAVQVAHRDDPEWSTAWRHAGEGAARAVAQVLADEFAAAGSLSGYDVAAAVVSATGPDTGLVIAASNPIRDADLVAGPVTAAFAIANRGLSGIDGTVSTATGASLTGAPTAVPVRALVGDLAFLHDTNAMLLGPDEPAPAVQVVVVNDGGGGIFGLLEHGQARFAASLARVFATPQRVDLAALCSAHGVAHTTATTRHQLTAALVEPRPGISVVEVPVRRDRERALAERLHEAVAALAQP